MGPIFRHFCPPWDPRTPKMPLEPFKQYFGASLKVSGRSHGAQLSPDRKADSSFINWSVLTVQRWDIQNSKILIGENLSEFFRISPHYHIHKASNREDFKFRAIFLIQLRSLRTYLLTNLRTNGHTTQCFFFGFSLLSTLLGSNLVHIFENRSYLVHILSCYVFSYEPLGKSLSVLSSVFKDNVFALQSREFEA